MRTIFWVSETALPMRCATRLCRLRIASVRSASAGVDHVAEADAYAQQAHRGKLTIRFEARTAARLLQQRSRQR